MTHAIIYAKRNGMLDFYESTPNFPFGMIADIRAVCDRAGAGYIGGLETTLRYAPVRSCYMLNVMVCNEGDMVHEKRLHWNVVTYLMDAETATRFFLQPWSAARRRAENLSKELLRDYHDRTLPNDLGKRLIGDPALDMDHREPRIPMPVLLRGAMYGRDELRTSKLFFQVPDNGTRELEALLRELPALLRKDISFHTDVCAPEDTMGVGICCCGAPVLERLENSGFNGCEVGNVFFHYSDGMNRRNRMDDRQAELVRNLANLRRKILRFDVLQFAVTDWSTYMGLADALLGRNHLREALKRLEDQDLEQGLQIAREAGIEPLSKQELKRFLSAAGGKSGLKKALRELRGRGGWLSGLMGLMPMAAPFLAAVMALAALLLQMWMLTAPAVWKSGLSMGLMFLAGAATWASRPGKR